jgi:fructose/tagatose bisphosphate aldolase
MQAARDGHYAVGYFESWNLESLQGVIDAAEAASAPVIIGFNGEFLSSPDRLAEERLSWYSALGRAAAESARVPCGFIFNECPVHEWVERAVTLGFNLVMPVPAAHETEWDYTRRSAALVNYAHAHGVAVEGELGTLPFGSETPGEPTDPQRAEAFVRATGVDLLAISAGNVHVLLHGRRTLDLERVAAVASRVNIPLVLHGGTGIDDESLRQAIDLGISKVNYGTAIKQAYLHAVQAALARTQPNPHRLLGMGEDDDVMVAGRQAVRDAVLAKMAALGCWDKAADHG